MTSTPTKDKAFDDMTDDDKKTLRKERQDAITAVFNVLDLDKNGKLETDAEFELFVCLDNRMTEEKMKEMTSLDDLSGILSSAESFKKEVGSMALDTFVSLGMEKPEKEWMPEWYSVERLGMVSFVKSAPIFSATIAKLKASDS
eukprot:TRINITY_DN1499_c0_g1_i1.p1 TRINITY_DN1499_c0_g1~~TRINITY_DN1499_c0_g1_i1.p1  ORF type:complete len:144 (+),score=47.21 TRINITY_DN1499_c0_g1_i1:59-490(+)